MTRLRDKFPPLQDESVTAGFRRLERLQEQLQERAESTVFAVAIPAAGGSMADVHRVRVAPDSTVACSCGATEPGLCHWALQALAVAHADNVWRSNALMHRVPEAELGEEVCARLHAARLRLRDPGGGEEVIF